MPLTLRQRRFAEEFVVDADARAAAMRAGVPQARAEEAGAALLAHPKVAAEIARLRGEGEDGEPEETKVDAGWLLRRLVDEVTADIADLYDIEGKLKPVDEWPAVWRQGLVQGLEIEERFEGRGNAREQVGFVKKVRLSDRLKRLELIGKHIGVKAFEETVRVKGLEGLGERLARAARRLAEEGE